MILNFDIFKPYADILTHGINTESLHDANGVDLIVGNQIHTDTINLISQKPIETLQGDAIITKEVNLPIAVKVADCQGILIFDPKTQSIAAIHSGWKSSCLNIIGKTVKRLTGEFGSDPKDLLVGISPSLGPCCAEFSDPKTELPDFVHPFANNRHVDFWALSLDQLKNTGIPEKQIEFKRECTKCHPNGYYSYRNNDENRMGVFISLK